MTASHTRALPGDAALATPSLARMLRVNHAGEYAAKRIYAAQLRVMGDHPLKGELEHMAAQEQVHLDTFNKLLPAYGVRPSLLMPLWHVASYALGAGTALLGDKAAMACTVAVETAITEHYNDQLAHPEVIGPELGKAIRQFRDEEMEHHDTALSHDAEGAPLYPLLSAVIRSGCKAAIWLAARF